MKEFDCYALGIVHSSVCSSLPPKEALLIMNQENPTGIKSQWALSGDETFITGQLNPCPCEASPETHKHYLLVC